MEVCTILILLILDIKKKPNIDQKDDEVFFRWLLNFYILLFFSLSMYMYTTYARQYTIKTKQENAQFQYALWNSFFFHFSFIIIWLCDVTFHLFRKLFWINTSPQSGALQIETGSFTGSDKKIFQSQLFINPSGLFFDGGLKL